MNLSPTSKPGNKKSEEYSLCAGEYSSLWFEEKAVSSEWVAVVDYMDFVDKRP
jgi:hypothetical protein